MVAWSCAVISAAGSNGWMGAPTSMVIGVFVRPSRLGWPFVHTRCDPQMTMGTTGTPASFAIRAAPDRNALSSKLRLIVSSGNTPTSCPARSASTARR